MQKNLRQRLLSSAQNIAAALVLSLAVSSTAWAWPAVWPAPGDTMYNSVNGEQMVWAAVPNTSPVQYSWTYVDPTVVGWPPTTDPPRDYFDETVVTVIETMNFFKRSIIRQFNEPENFDPVLLSN